MVNPTAKRYLVVVLSLTVSLLAASWLGVVVYSPAQVLAQGDPASATVNAVNAYRVANGLAPLQVNSILMATAQNHASWMAVNYTYSHTGAGGSSPQSRARAAGYSGNVLENFFLGSAASAQDAVNWWMTSPVHNAGMLATPHTEIGVGYATNDNARIYVLLVGNPLPPTPVPQNSSGAAPEEEEPAGPPVVMIMKSEPQEDGSVVHPVQQGQTLWDISAVYGVGLDQLAALNYLKPGAVIHPGDEILVQLGPNQTPPPPPEIPVRHLVEEGETIWEIAVLNGLTVDELLDLNGLTRADVLVPGIEILLRPEATEEAPAATPPPDGAAPQGAGTAAPAANSG